MLQPDRRSIRPEETTDEVAWSLASLPGVFVRSYGGLGDMRTLSSGGGSSAHTTILLENIPLNSPQNGSLDLALLPLNQTGEIEYLSHGGSSPYGASALSSIVNLVARENATGISAGTGSFGYRFLEGRLAAMSDHYGLAIGQSSSRGDFAYRWNNRQFRRQNNRYRQRYLRSNGKWTLGPLTQHASIWLTDSDRGIPGQVWAVTPDASQSDLWALATVTTDWTILNTGHRLQVFWQTQQQQYVDSTILIASDHNVAMLGSGYEFSFKVSSKINSLLRIDLKRTELRSTDIDSTATGVRRRLQADLSQQLIYQLGSKWAIRPVGRVSRIADGSGWITGDVAIHYESPKHDRLTSLTFVTGRNYRYPSFNDLYWQPGGNPNLRSETSKSIAAKSTWQLGSLLVADVKITHTDFNDLIRWVPGSGGQYHAVNIHQSVSTSWMGRLSGSLLKERLIFMGGLNYVDSRNRERGPNYGKPLRYTPQLTANLRGELMINPVVRLVLMGLGNSGYISYYDYPYDRKRPPVWTWDTLLRWHFRLRREPSIDLSATLAVLNIFDREIEGMPGYQEPGRSLKLTINAERD